MWTLLVNFLNYALTVVLRVSILKFIAVTAIVALVAALSYSVFQYLEQIDFLGLSNLYLGLPPSVKFFAVYFQAHVGIPLLISAAIVRFSIRRLPVVG